MNRLRIFIYLLVSVVSLHAGDKVAILFLTRQDLNQPEVWKTFFEGEEENFSIYVHAKYPPKDPWLRQYCLRKTVPTTWANTIRAEKLLLIEALRDPENMKFVLVSESCVPLVSSHAALTTLLQDDRSAFWFTNVWWSETHERTVTEIPLEHRWCNAQWFVLNRKHAQICVDDDEVLNLIAQHPADNEAWPSSLLSMKGELVEVNNKSYTFVDWSRPNGSHPYLFSSANPYDLQLLWKVRSEGYLLARKFSQTFPSHLLLQFQTNHESIDEQGY